MRLFIIGLISILILNPVYGSSALRANQPQTIGFYDYSKLLGPVRNQGDIQICFAMAVADALSFETGKRVSAMSVAVRYYENRQGWDNLILGPTSGFFQAGIVDSVLKANLDKTLCETAELAEEQNSSLNKEQLQELLSAYNQFRVYFGPQPPVALKERVVKLVSETFPEQNAKLFYRNFRREKPLVKALGDFFSEQCHIQIPSAGRKVITVLDRNKFQALIDHSLTRKKIPIIHYNVFPFIHRQIGPFEALANLVVGTHVSTIVGQRKVQNRVQYLVRNTWGDLTCSSYKAVYQQNCENGHLWVDQLKLFPQVTSVSFLN
jgi:hypothetical protein